MKLKVLAVILSGIAFALVATLIGFALYLLWSFVLPNVDGFYMTQAFRPFDHPLTIGLFLLPFIEGFIFAAFYSIFERLIAVRGAFAKGSTYGLYLFILTSVPWLVLIYSLFDISVILFVMWTLESLVRYYLGCGVLAVVYEKFSK
ncbi:MAG TPA: hypothetical protein VJG83_05270 [archaeon]|nr:hypothetical protein [archaeon]